MSEFQPQTPMGGAAPKDPQTAFLIELVGGIFGLFGLGHIYAGYQDIGIKRLVVGIVALVVLWTITSFLMALIIGCVIAPVLIGVQIYAAYVSAKGLREAITTGTTPPNLFGLPI